MVAYRPLYMLRQDYSQIGLVTHQKRLFGEEVGFACSRKVAWAIESAMAEEILKGDERSKAF